MVQLEEYLFGIPLSTHRSRDVEHAQFPYELVISTIAIVFFRTTIYQDKEPKVFRWLFASLLGFLTYIDNSYDLICAVEIFSYAVPFLLLSDFRPIPKDSNSRLMLWIASSAFLSFAICHFAASGALFRWMSLITPSFLLDALAAAVPAKEVKAAYDTLDRFILEPGLLNVQLSRLLFTSFHIQVGIGYLGIDFLKQEQERRNQLVRMDMSTDSEDEGEENDKQDKSNKEQKPEQKKEDSKLRRSKKFQRSAAPFIFFTAVPYMVQIIFYGNLNAFSYACFKDDVHRAVRLYDLFDHDNHLVAVASHSAKSPDGKQYKTQRVCKIMRPAFKLT